MLTVHTICATTVFVSDPLIESATKQRVSVSLDPAVIPVGEALAKADRRSFSNLLEVLILKEYERRCGRVPQESEVAS